MLAVGINVICRGEPAPASGIVQRLRIPVAGLLNSSIPVIGTCVHIGSQACPSRRTAELAFDSGSLSKGAFQISHCCSSVVPTSLFPSADTLHEVNVPPRASVTRRISPDPIDTESKSAES